MGEKLKPRFKSDFDLVPEGIHIFRTDKASVEASEKESVKNFKVESIVEGGDAEGGRIFDNFPLVSKKNFGLERMCGFLIKLGIFKPKEEFDADIFTKPDFEEKFGVGVPGKLFGGRVRHTKSKQSDNMMANIAEYYTVKEAEEEMKKPKSKPGVGGKKEESPPAEDFFAE